MTVIIRHSREGKTGDVKKIHGEEEGKVGGVGLTCTHLCLKWISRDFPGGPVVETSPSKAGLIPTQAAKIPHAPWPKNQNIKQKQYCEEFNKN